MSNIETKEHILISLNDRFEELSDWLQQHSDDRYEKGPEGKWTTGQHIDHLLKSTKPLNTALRLPKIQLKMMFGKSNRQGRTYAQLVKRYHEKLAGGGKAEGRYVPKVPSLSEKQRLLEDLLKERDKLLKIIPKWKDEDMDAFVLPHPLLGKLTVREMLFFAIYHTGHHAKLLADNY